MEIAFTIEETALFWAISPHQSQSFLLKMRLLMRFLIFLRLKVRLIFFIEIAFVDNTSNFASNSQNVMR